VEAFPVRIAYGVFGYGRGHATRSAAVLSALIRQHQVLILAGGDAYDQLSLNFPVVRIPSMGYAYAPGGKRSNYLTLRQNAWYGLDVLFGGPVSQQVTAALSDFRPDVVISDAEPWTHQAARRLRIPRIGFDHFGILAHCRVPMPLLDRLLSVRDVWIYRMLMGRPERVIVSSFYPAPPRGPGIEVVGPLLRDEVLRFRPRDAGHYLCYLNKGEHLFTPRVEAALQHLPAPVLVYGTQRRGVHGRLDFRPLSNVPFVEDLAGCRAVISTAGNQLVGEALYLSKPMLVMPEDCVEQRLNAAAVARLGIGMATRMDRLSPAVVAEFVRREAEFREGMRRHVRDGRAEALSTIERYLRELAPDAEERSRPDGVDRRAAVP
jgi:uncharacterized protein (TIGR00661 family)